MENFANIHFSNDLVRNKSCKITYTGYLFEKGSDSLTIVYGFNPNWENTSEKEMQKTDNGFCVEINMQNYDSFNFCFRNSNYEWDNNYNNNYTANILPENVENEISNDDSICFDELFENVEVGNSSNIQDFEVSIINNQSMNIEDTLVNSTEETSLNSDIENLFENIYTESEKNTTIPAKTTIYENTNTDNFSMDSLIEEILSPIASSNSYNNSESQTMQNVSNEDLDNSVDNLINALISDIYTSTVDAQTNTNTSSTQSASNELFSTDENVDSTNIIEESNLTDENIEGSLINTLESSNTTASNKSTNELTVSPKALSKFYLFRKKIKITFYKLFRFMFNETDSNEM